MGAAQTKQTRSILNRRKALALSTLAAAALMIGLGSDAGFAQTKPGVTIGIPNDLTTMDAHRISSGSDDNVFGNTNEPLFGHAPDGKLVPILAESVSISSDGLTYDFQLRKNVKFHNGDPFTAEDVRYSWERANDPKTLNPRRAVVVGTIADMEVVDAHHVRMKLKAPDASVLENMENTFYIVGKKYMTEGPGKDDATRVPMGTGPFVYVDRKVREFIKLKAYEGHWGRVPQISEVTYKIVPDDQTRIAMLQTGEADVVASIPAVVAAKLGTPKDFKILRSTSFVNMFLHFNTRNNNPDLKKPEVRRAFNMAVNKKVLVNSITAGFATLQDGAACSPAILGCNPPPPSYGYDPKAAREMLVKAGFDFARPVKLVGPASGRIPQSREAIEAVAYSLQQIGVKTTIEIMEYGAWLSGEQQAKQPKNPASDLVFSQFPDYNINPAGRLRRSVYTDGVASWFSDKQLDEMIDKLNTLPTEAERVAHARAIFQRMHELAPDISLWAFDSIYGVRNNIEWEPQFGSISLFLWNLKKVTGS